MFSPLFKRFELHSTCGLGKAVHISVYLRYHLAPAFLRILFFSYFFDSVFTPRMRCLLLAA